MKTEKLSLPEYQRLIKRLGKERGFDSETIAQKFTLLMEECGELAKAARKVAQISTHQKYNPFDIEEEAADVFWVLIDICNSLGVDLEEAFEKKEKLHQKRKWS